MIQAELIQLARDTAKAHNLFPEIVCAIAEQESSWAPFAMRYEPAFYEHYIMPLVNKGEVKRETEARARAVSWGLGQVMGQLARELGFKGKFLSELCDPLVGLEYLCRALNQKLGFASGNMEKALLFYNGGGNPNYPTEVLARVEKYKSQEAT